LISAALGATAQAQAQTQQRRRRPRTTRSPTTVYIFRYGGPSVDVHVTPQAVIATDPISERRPAAALHRRGSRPWTKAPIKYVIYSHSHFDHIAGGKPFRTWARCSCAPERKGAHRRVKSPDVVTPDQVVGRQEEHPRLADHDRAQLRGKNPPTTRW